MHTKFRIGCLVFTCLVLYCDGYKINEYGGKVDKKGGTNNLEDKNKSENRSDINNVTDQGRGFLLHGGLFSLGKVLNFFPVGGERECKPSAYTIAGAGICLNPYDCRQRDGRASGDCAQGLGVCCVFEVSCGATVQNNLTYFMSPRFPELWSGEEDCTIHIEKTHAGIMQLRIDFVHFTIGQPNRTTGECIEDAMILGEGANNFTLCGQNHGQHIYYTLPSTSETREAGELPATKSIPLVMRMRGSEKTRLWLLRLAQMPLAYSSPHNCLQYHTENNGTIKTFNFASNGRHLSSQEYRVCVRRGAGRCAVRYTPCHQNSFRIGAGEGPGGGGSGFQNQLQNSSPHPNIVTESPALPPPTNDPVDEEEGSGADPMIMDTSTPTPGVLSRIWAYMWGSRQRSWGWSPYHQHHALWYGSGGHGRRRCGDRLTIPCDNEYLVTVSGHDGYYKSPFAMPVCDPHRCGSSLCGSWPCRVESSVTPFAVSVHFGPPVPKQDPDMNLGACLKYEQLPCD